MSDNPTGVLLLAFGGPDSPQAIEPFMRNLMGGRIPAPGLVEKVRERYRLIGGKSPLPEITARQAEELERYLNSRDHKFKVAVGMCHWHPFIDEGVRELLDAGTNKIIAVSLAPFFSSVSTGAYQEELERVILSLEGNIPEVLVTGPLYNNPFFIAAVAEKVSTALTELPVGNVERTAVIFSAHSLPVSYIKTGEPYVDQFEYTVQKIAAKLNLDKPYIAYQSKGGGRGEWLGPLVEDVMKELSDKDVANVLVVPVGFVSDHIETLYDIDEAQKRYAVSLGLNFHRSASLNTSALFIRALGDLIMAKVDK